MKKILLVTGNTRNNFKRRMNLETLQQLTEDKNNEVYILDCNRKMKNSCWILTNCHRWGYCKKCLGSFLDYAKKIGFDKKNILKMQKIKNPQIPDFLSIKDAINYEIEGYNVGIGPVSSLMTKYRDYQFNIKNNQKNIKKFITACYTTLKNIEYYHKQIGFDEIYIFNGRFSVNYGAATFAIKNGIDYTVYDRGANLNKIWYAKNNLIHDFYYVKKEIAKHWNSTNGEKESIAKEWFKNRRKGKFQAYSSFTKDQIKELLPKNFDTNKENIGIFNSSIDEVFAYESWQHPFVEHDNILIKNILEHYKNDESKHFYLRVHPNLTKAKQLNSSQIREINEFKTKYKNLTVIEPDDKIDTYALIEAVDKVVTSYSTVSCEATYWSSIAILAGKALYEDLDCAYQAKTMEEVYQLIDNKNLKPKPKENSYPYGYYQAVFGKEMKYYRLEEPTVENINKMKFI